MRQRRCCSRSCSQRVALHKAAQRDQGGPKVRRRSTPALARTVTGGLRLRARWLYLYRSWEAPGEPMLDNQGVHWARGVVVSHPLSMREALGSIPSVSSCSSAVLLDLGGSFCLWRPVVISPTRCCCWLGAAWLAGAGSCSCKAVAAVAVAACMQHQQLNKPRPTAADMCSNS